MFTVLLFAGGATLVFAWGESSHGPTHELPIAVAGVAVGDDCSDPIVISGLPFTDTGQTTCGRGNSYTETCLGYYDAGEDVIYQFTLDDDAFVRVTLDPLGNLYGGILIDDSCPPDGTCVAYMSGSSGSIPRIMSLELAAGTYTVMIDTWAPPDCLPSYDLTIEEFRPPCADAIDLQEQSLMSFDINTCGGGADLSPTNSCTGFESGAPSEDLEYKIYLEAGESFRVELTGEDSSYDASIYMLADCLDMNSCVAGGDDHENFDFTAEAAGWYYLIVDGFSGCGTATVTIDAPVSTERMSWGTLKSVFR